MKEKMFAFILILFILTVSCEKNDGVYHSISGSWRCEEYNPISGQRVYMVDIDRSSRDSTEYLLSNFHNEDINEFVYAHLRDSVLSINEQVFASLIVKVGKGLVSSDFRVIEFEYQVYDGQNDYRVQAHYSRPD
jgi:hypothetical protein